MKTAVHQYEDKLLEFAYGELPAPEAAAVDAHVRGCARCTEALSQITIVRSTMSALPLAPAPDAGLESLLAYAEQTAKRNADAKKQSVWWRRYLMPLASASALLLVGVVAWRASQEFNPDPGMVALEMQKEKEATAAKAADGVAAAPASVAQAPAEQAEEQGTFEAKQQVEKKAGERREDKAKGEATADAEGALAAAEPTGQGGLGARDEEARKATERMEDANKQADAPMRSKLGARTNEGWEASGGDQAGGKAPAPAKPKPASKVSRSQRDAQLDDFSNAAQRGAPAPAKDRGAMKPPPKEAPAAQPAPEPDTSPVDLSKNQKMPGTQSVWGSRSTPPGFGLGTGSTGSASAPQPPTGAIVGGAGSAELKESAKKESASERKKSKAPTQQPAREEEAPQQVAQAAQPPPPPAPAPVASSAPQTKVSLGLPKGQSSSASTRSSQGEEDDALMGSTDKLAVDSDAKFAERTQAELRQKNLESARSAGNRNDRMSEVKFALAVLGAGARGSERLEALKRVCDGYEAMGEYDRAEGYCETLVKEFPNTSAAQQVAQRRSRMQKAPAPAKARATERSYDYESAPAEAKEPPKPSSAPSY
ncbi:MAG: hypothetical protein AMXMBFR34_28660 [Myxococcaceae bacterium]